MTPAMFIDRRPKGLVVLIMFTSTCIAVGMPSTQTVRRTTKELNIDVLALLQMESGATLGSDSDPPPQPAKKPKGLAAFFAKKKEAFFDAVAAKQQQVAQDEDGALAKLKAKLQKPVDYVKGKVEEGLDWSLQQYKAGTEPDTIANIPVRGKESLKDPGFEQWPQPYWWTKPPPWVDEIPSWFLRYITKYNAKKSHLGREAYGYDPDPLHLFG